MHLVIAYYLLNESGRGLEVKQLEKASRTESFPVVETTQNPLLPYSTSEKSVRTALYEENRHQKYQNLRIQTSCTPKNYFQQSQGYLSLSPRSPTVRDKGRKIIFKDEQDKDIASQYNISDEFCDIVRSPGAGKRILVDPDRGIITTIKIDIEEVEKKRQKRANNRNKGILSSFYFSCSHSDFRVSPIKFLLVFGIWNHSEAVNSLILASTLSALISSSLFLSYFLEEINSLSASC